MLASTSVGTKTLTATYGGDAEFAPSSAITAHTVNQAATTVTVLSDAPDPSDLGQPYTVQWSVAVTAPGAGTPTGNVTVSAPGTTGCTAPVAVGHCDAVSTTAGNKTLTVAYAGDANFLASSRTTAHAVNKGAQTIDFGPLSDRAYGDNFTASATASSGLVGEVHLAHPVDLRCEQHEWCDHQALGGGAVHDSGRAGRQRQLPPGAGQRPELRHRQGRRHRHRSRQVEGLRRQRADLDGCLLGVRERADQEQLGHHGGSGVRGVRRCSRP